MLRWIRGVSASIVFVGAMLLMNPAPALAGECGEDCYDCDVHAGGECMTCCEWVNGVFVGCDTRCYN